MQKSRVIALVVVVGVVLVAILLYRAKDKSLPIIAPLITTHERVGYRVTASRNKEVIKPGDFARHRFTVEENGQLVNLLNRSIFPHVAVVSDDLSDITFYHVDRLSIPRDGIYEFDHQFAANSGYTLWFEINDNSTEDHHGDNPDFISYVDVPVTVSGAETAINKLKTSATDRTYSLRLETDNLLAGQPGTVRIFVDEDDGIPARILKDYEQHFFFVANPKTNYYVLDHFDEKLSTAASVASSITFPEPGTYALWGRIFLSDGSGNAIDLVEGAFTLQVQ